MPRDVAEKHLVGLDAPQVEMKIVFPRESDAAMDLQALTRKLGAGRADHALRSAHREGEGGAVGLPRRVMRRNPRALKPVEHVRALVLDRLVVRDRLAEG